MPKTAAFYAIYEDFGTFTIAIFCPIWAVQKVFYGHFLRFWRKSDPKTCITPTKVKILKLPFFDIVTLDGHELSQGHKRLRRVLKSILDTVHAVPSALFQFDTAALPGGASKDKKSKNWRLTPVTSSVTVR